MPPFDRRSLLKALAAAGLTAALPLPVLAASAPRKARNILFIAVDDLRPQLGCYGNAIVKSPNIDALAASGFVFERAYCQQALCAPSRASLLTGVRPDSTGVTDLETPLASVRPDLVSLPKLLKQNGFETVSLGKIYHHAQKDDPEAWSTRPWLPGGNGQGKWVGGHYASEEAKRLWREGVRGKESYQLWPTEAPDVPDNHLPDGLCADKAIGELQRLGAGERPFFLAVGFIKPHLPFVAPKKYWDLYRREDFAPSPQRNWPTGAPKEATPDWGELRGYLDMPKQGPVSDDEARQLIHGYHACVSYTDAQIGRLLAELDRLGLREDTAVVLWGDHGWKLSDYGAWTKHTNFEIDTHAPLILRAPGYIGGERRRQLVEFVDIYPTLAELVGLPSPASVEGTSFVPLLGAPQREWKSASFSQYPRGKKVMGYSVRNERWRYTEWRQNGNVIARELYDHATSDIAPRNLIDEPTLADTVRQLAAQLRAGWQAARPA